MASTPALYDSKPRKTAHITAIAVTALVTSIVGMNWWHTASLAKAFGYHPALGKPLMTLPLAGPIYAPWDWVLWMFKFWNSAPERFQSATIQVLLTVIASLAFFGIVMALFVRRHEQHKGVYGTAEFANRDAVINAGLVPGPTRPNRGVYVGGYEDQPAGLLSRLRGARSPLTYLRHDGPEHVIAIAPPRSGKGVGLVIPTCLDWPHSMLVYDLKGELYQASAGYRSSEAGGNVVLRFAPTEEEGCARYNPLSEVRWGTVHEVADVQNIWTILLDSDGKGVESDHFRATAYAAAVGITIHLHYRQLATKQPVTLSGISYAMGDPDQNNDDLWEEMKTNAHLAGRTHPAYASVDADGVVVERHPVVATAGANLLNTTPRERSGVLSSIRRALHLYADPVVGKNLSESHWTIDDLVNYEKPVTLYVIVPPDSQDRMTPLLRLLFTQIIRVLTRSAPTFDKQGLPKPCHKHRLLLMFDEFASLGRLEYVANSLSFITGYGMKAFLILQTLEQLHKEYGKDEQITGTCQVHIGYPTASLPTCEFFSKHCGTTTVIANKNTSSGGRFAPLLKGSSNSFSETARKLITPEEFKKLGTPEKDANGHITRAGRMLILVTGHPPILGRQILYFADRVFAARSRILPPKTGRIRPPATRPPEPQAHPGRPALAAPDNRSVIHPMGGERGRPAPFSA